MKVGMLTSISDKCGISDYSRRLSENLSKLAEVIIVPVYDSEKPWEVYLKESSEVLNSCDVIHIQHEYSFWRILPGPDGLLGTFSAQRSRLTRPVVLTAHTLDTLTQLFGIDKNSNPSPRTIAKRLLNGIPRFRYAVETEPFKTADRVIIHDRPMADRLIDRGIPPEKIRIIVHGASSADLRPELGEAFRAKYGTSGKKLIVVFGFVRPGRGYEATLDILSRLDKNVILVIAGGPQTAIHESYLKGLTSDIESRKLSDRVIITGYLPESEVPGVIQSADVILCSQESGTASGSLKVALPYGRPIVASDLPCFKHIEDSSGCLITHRLGDNEDLLKKINLALSDESLSKEMVANALRHADECSWDKVAAETKQVYDELLSGK